MPRKKKKTRRQQAELELFEAAAQSKFKQDVLGILLIALGIFVFVANLSSATGLIGLFVVKTFLRSAIGVGVLVLPVFISLYGIILLLRHEVKELAIRLSGLMVLFFDYIAIAQFYSNNYFTGEVANLYFAGAGGAVGYAARYVLGRTVGLWGSYIILTAIGAIGLLMLFNVTVLSLIDFLRGIFVFGQEGEGEEAGELDEEPKAKTKKATQLPLPVKKEKDKEGEKELKAPPPPPPPVIISSTVTKEEKEYKGDKGPYLTVHKEPTVIQEKVTVIGDYKLPPISLLESPTAKERKQAQEMEGMINGRKDQLETALKNFGIGAHVVAIYQGPAVTRYELQPEPGIKVSRIYSLANDISLAMAAQGIRIEAPVPGKSVVGIEVPNPIVTPVRLKEIAESRDFQNHASKLAFCLGKDLAGHPIVGDLETMPHLLIAGTTGSGKSVCLNSIITSFLLRAAPNELKFIMIDPKMVELSVYNGIAHLLAPVVTNVKKAAITLKVWVLQEMNRRYELFHAKGARNINAYNKKMSKPEDKLPYVVVIVDELADLMMVAANEVEQSICRIAQMARATGIHMIIATQRPSVDVITGLIKANIPSRIAFAVATQIDSRVILDASGAEKLLGRGDMLYSPIGSMKPMRGQGCFVIDKEIEDVVGHVQKQCAAEYIEEIQTIKALDFERKDNGGLGEGEGGEGGRDALFDEVAKLIVSTGQASTSYVQRKFRIGYNRAARLMDEMEAAGVVSAPEGENKPRRILATLESLAQKESS
ncbi:cell division protein FtsK [Candidatus Saganbacteria bacterium CG08_land_8_20_14_0_20_45_16]|uniref:Cell division protein FtsK n=1 Tax=Candidatus Saganbacteria bacterium CG08_land_8_20_14_0_20_45_16 TaxID=2014293 RepID=A0A2H0Y2P3_UNCSA|nr:MAG: cell division protein FtsK [Candidatus Saganbacteria bacterium CG08_land_8_20_14_0_20_45_16]